MQLINLSEERKKKQYKEIIAKGRVPLADTCGSKDDNLIKQIQKLMDLIKQIEDRDKQWEK